MNHVDLDAALQTAVDAARQAAKVLADWRARFTVREKGRADLVTEADEAAQSAVQSVIQAHFPDHGFLGEEGSVYAAPSADGPPTWIVDPIDGTTNYVHDLPCYAISIALWSAGELVLGVVYDPTRDEMFHAVKGHGAWLGDRRLRVTETADLGQTLLTVGFPPDQRGHELQLDRWKRLALRTRGLRRTGSTAINLAYVAAGRFDAFWADGLKAWDVAGGVVLVREAGGMVTGLHSEDYNLFRPEILASNGRIHFALQSLFESV
jgi:myo-inositol-1(or 4)-monophosphatase